MKIDTRLHDNAKIYIAGHRGLVGSAIVRELNKSGHRNLVLRTRSELDLTNADAVSEFFARERPSYVFLAAAKVGGIWANNTYPGEFIFENLMMEANVIEAARQTKVARLLFLGSSCIYPKFASQPLSEQSLLTGSLEETNRPYAVAKIAGIEMCWAYNRQYGMKFLAAMPTNLYGPGDNYDLATSHVIPAMVRKMHEAKEQQKREVILWGTGTPRREFIYSDDLAEACVFLMSLPDEKFDSLTASDHMPLINVGVGEDQTIRDLAHKIAKVVGFNGTLRFDSSKADGTPRKLLDVSRLSGLGWRATTPLDEGLRRAYRDYLTSVEPAVSFVPTEIPQGFLRTV